MLIVLVLASVVLVAFYNFHWKRRKLPPGPTPWPLLGNLLSVAKDKSGYRQFRKWADQFGPVFTVWWAEEPYILIADYELMKDAYVKNGDAFSGRHMLPISDILSAANHSAGVARINGEHWKELRRFSMKLLRDLGVGRNGMQERILPTVKAIMRKLDTDLSNGVSEFNMLPLLNFFTANVINELTFATGFDGSHHEHYQQLMHLSETIHSNFTSLPGVMLALMPFLRHVPLFKHTYNKMNGPWEAFHTYFESGIQQRIAYREQMNGVRRLSVLRSRTGSISSAMRKRSGSGGNREQAELQRRKTSGAHRRKISGEKPIISSILKSQQPSPVEAADLDSAPAVFQQPVRKFSSAAVGRKVSRVQWTVVVEREQSPSECFVDLFLDRLDQLGQDKFLNMDSLRGMCFDLFVGGQEPTASTLGFMIIYLLLDQQRQRKLHAEFDAFAGEQGWTGEWEEDEWIELADRPKLPYMNAVINETQRIANLLPMNLTHMTTQDTHVGDYPIPKGIAVVAQMSCLFCDPKLFPEPEKFIPERFIDENGQLRKCDELIPFSLGKRNCIGEGLARAELFLFAANFFNRFRVLPADPLRPPSIEKKVYFTSMPFPFRCCLVRRRHPPSQGGAADFESRLLCASSSSSSLHAADEEVPVFPVLPAQQQPQAEADTLEKENDKKLALDKEDAEEEDVEDEELAMDAKGDKKKKAFKQRKNGIYQQQQHPQQLISSWEAKQRN